MKNLTISIPCYNDKNSLAELLNEIKSLNLQNKYNLNILIIDDGSDDYSFEMINNYNFENIPFKVLRNEVSKGFGDSFKKAFTIPESDWVFFISGDNQFPVKNLQIMEEYIEDFELIIGLRNKIKDNVYRRINSKIYNLIISIVAGKKINDVNSTLLFKSSILHNIRLTSNSAFINAEFILKAFKNGAKL